MPNDTSKQADASKKRTSQTSRRDPVAQSPTRPPSPSTNLETIPSPITAPSQKSVRTRSVAGHSIVSPQSPNSNNPRRNAPTPGHLPPERLAFLYPRVTANPRAQPTPGSLPEEAKQPYLGPQVIETRIPKGSPRSWSKVTGKDTERPDSRGSGHSLYSDDRVLSATGVQSSIGNAGVVSSDIPLRAPIASRPHSALAMFLGGNDEFGEHSMPRYVTNVENSDSDVSGWNLGTAASAGSVELATAPPEKLQTNPQDRDSVSEAISQKDLLPPQSSIPDILDNVIETIPLHLSAFDYAIAPYLENCVDTDDNHLCHFPSPTDAFSGPSSQHSSEQDSLAQYSHRHEQLYPPPSPERGENLDFFLHNLTTEMRVRYVLLRTVLTRCAILAAPIVDRTTKSNITPITDYYRICKIARRYALPIAKKLDMEGFQALSYYWIARGEAGLRNWTAAERAFEDASSLDITGRRDLLPRGQGKDFYAWLEKVREEKKRHFSPHPNVEYSDDELDGYWETAQQVGSLEAELPQRVLPPAWFPEEVLERRELTAKDWNYVKHTSRDIEEDWEEVERKIAQDSWKIAQKKNKQWLSLYEKLSGSGETQKSQETVKMDGFHHENRKSNIRKGHNESRTHRPSHKKVPKGTIGSTNGSSNTIARRRGTKTLEVATRPADSSVPGPAKSPRRNSLKTSLQGTPGTRSLLTPPSSASEPELHMTYPPHSPKPPLSRRETVIESVPKSPPTLPVRSKTLFDSPSDRQPF